MTTTAKKNSAHAKETTAEKTFGISRQLVLGLLFGLIFGFLLQKGGVAKYHVLIGVLLLKDFTVVKVMLSAIVVGTVGLQILRSCGLVKKHIKPTRLGVNIIGGLIFGVGFGLIGYCPGTGAAALGQGNFDAIAGVLGLIAGSFLFAELSGWLGRTVMKVGDMGELTLPELIHANPNRFVLLWVPTLMLCLIAISYFGGRSSDSFSESSKKV